MSSSEVKTAGVLLFPLFSWGGYFIWGYPCWPQVWCAVSQCRSGAVVGGSGACRATVAPGSWDRDVFFMVVMLVSEVQACVHLLWNQGLHLWDSGQWSWPCVCVCVCMLGRPALAQAWDHRVQQCLWPRGGAGCSSRRPWEWWVRVPTLVPQRVELEIVAAWLCWLEVNATTSWGRSQNPGGGHRATTVQPSDGRTKQWLTTPGAGHREALVPSPTCVMTNQSHN